jgi:hypothetical protein
MRTADLVAENAEDVERIILDVEGILKGPEEPAPPSPEQAAYPVHPAGMYYAVGIVDQPDQLSGLMCPTRGVRRAWAPPARRGRAPRRATNARRRGSRRCGGRTRARAGPDEADPPSRHLAAPRRPPTRGAA